MATTSEFLMDEEVEWQAQSAPQPVAHVVVAAEPPRSIDQVLVERPDVLGAFYEAFYDSGAYKRPQDWQARFGAATPEDFAKVWIDRHGKWEGYAREPGEAVDVDRLIHDRPDVMAAYYTGFYEQGNDRRPEGWIEQIGGTSLEDYAKFWFDRHGKWEGYTQSPTGETLSAAQILQDRPDVLRAFYVEFYEHGAFKNPGEWIARLGGKSPEDYAKFWYDRHGQWEGYHQHTPPVAAEPEPLPPEPVAEEQVVELVGSAPEDAAVFA